MGDWRAELCYESYAAFRRRDAEAAAALYDPECEWEVGAASAALGETFYRGHIGVQSLMSDINEVFPDWRPVVEELRLREDGAVLVRATVEGTARDTGMALQMPVLAQVIEFRDRRILRVTQTDFPPPGWDDAAGLD
ncbi:MAG: nuclear transport factor 2 family protein [Solirubrobacterales bacterium]